MIANLEVITPDKARQYLSLQKSNFRKVSYGRVRRYAQEMKAGKWRVNGEGIHFDLQGNLVNGQTRLRACIEANVPFTTLVVRDVEETGLYDKALSRTQAQELKSRGILIKTIEIGALNFIYRTVFNTKDTPTETINCYIEDHLDELKRFSSAVRSKTTNDGSPVVNSGCLACAYALYKTNVVSLETIESFFGVANSGNSVGCEEPSPALVARRVLSRKHHQHDKDRAENFYIILMAMKDFQNKRARLKDYTTKNVDLYKEVKSVCTGISDIMKLNQDQTVEKGE